jgi:hypothetical protein
MSLLDAEEAATTRPRIPRRPQLVTRMAVHPPEGEFTVPSYAIGEQTRTVLTRRLVKPLGMLSAVATAKVADVVHVLRGLRCSPHAPMFASNGLLSRPGGRASW